MTDPHDRNLPPFTIPASDLEGMSVKNIVPFTLPDNPALMVLSTQGEEVLRIEATRTVFRGAEIHDAGEVHRALLSVLTGFMPVWQRIKTAPKDGSAILAWSREEQMMVVAWDRLSCGWVEASQLAAIPTHWMPLPSPPK